MKHTQIACDACGNDISSTGQMPAYRLELSAERLPHTSNTVFAVCVLPPLARPHHFCGMNCLSVWMKTSPEEERAA